jgi:hypothetical protein
MSKEQGINKGISLGKIKKLRLSQSQQVTKDKKKVYISSCIGKEML